MNFDQVIPFSQSKGGKTPNLCLDNVSKGFGISGQHEYNTAWEAWQHTQQHADSNVPAGVDVPLFYSYSATIDGVYANYGHVNVRLANGQVWSDGNLYASIAAYLVNHAPKFVGWGESLNNFEIIKGVTMDVMTGGRIYNLLYWAVSPSVAEKAKAVNYEGYFGAGIGTEVGQAYDGIIGSPQFAEMVAAARTPAKVIPYSGPPLFTEQS